MTRFLAPAPQGPLEPASAPPSFSIVIAAYEAAETIAEAIESALAQTFPAKEIVVCDDGSRDDLAAALAPFRDRIVLLSQENRGPSAARNAAVSEASGDFVANLDADDALEPDSLAECAELIAQRPDLDIVVTDGAVELDGAVLRRMYRPDWTFEVDDQRTAILHRCFITTHWLVRRARFLEVGGFDESFRHAEDWELFIRLILSGSRAGMVDRPLLRYRLSQGSLSNQVVPLGAGRLRALEKTLARTDLSGEERAALREKIEAERFHHMLDQVREALLRRDGSARRESRRLISAPNIPLGIRVRALLASLFPGPARRVLARRGRPTAAGITLPVEQ